VIFVWFSFWDFVSGLGKFFLFLLGFLSMFSSLSEFNKHQSILIGCISLTRSFSGWEDGEVEYLFFQISCKIQLFSTIRILVSWHCKLILGFCCSWMMGYFLGERMINWMLVRVESHGAVGSWWTEGEVWNCLNFFANLFENTNLSKFFTMNFVIFITDKYRNPAFWISSQVRVGLNFRSGHFILLFVRFISDMIVTSLIVLLLKDLTSLNSLLLHRLKFFFFFYLVER
jgi:hypothetical protein